MKILTVLTVLFGLAGNCATAQTIILKGMEREEQKYTQAQAHAMDTLVPWVSLLNNWDNVAARLTTFYRKADPQGDGFTLSDTNIDNMVGDARRRSIIFERWMALDLDDDLQITDKDIVLLARRPMDARMGNQTIRIAPTDDQVDEIVSRFKSAARLPDKNRDGIVTLDEMIEVARAEKPSNLPVEYRVPEVRLEFDTDGDGILTLDEYIEVHQQVYDLFDADGNKSFDRAERMALANARQETNPLRN